MVTEPIAYRIEPVLGVVGGDLYLRQIARGNVIFGGGEGAISQDWLRSRPKPDVAYRERDGHRRSCRICATCPSSASGPVWMATRPMAAR